MIFGKASREDATVVAMLASALRRDVSFGALAPDEKLKIEQLRQRYGGPNHSMLKAILARAAQTALGLLEQEIEAELQSGS